MPKGFLVKGDRCEIAVPAYRAQQSAFALFGAGGRCVPASYAAAAFGPFSFDTRSNAFAASCWSEAEHAARLLATVANEADARRLAFSLAPRAAGWLTPPAEASPDGDSVASVASGGATAAVALEHLAPAPPQPPHAAAAAETSTGARKSYVEGRRRGVAKGAVGASRKKRRSHVMRKIHFDNEPPVSGIIIRRPPPPLYADCQLPSPSDQQLRLLVSSARAEETAAEPEDKEETPGDCGRLVSGDIDSKYNVVEITEEAKARLASIENRIGSFVCRLCNHLFPDAFRFAQHRCPSIVYVEYKCPECGKAFNCPANLASHRRWHKPRGGPSPPQPLSSQQRQPQQQEQETPPESPTSGAPASPLGGCGERGRGVRLEAVVAHAVSSYYISDELQRATTSSSPLSPADPSPRDGSLLRCRQCGHLFKKMSALGRHVLDMHSEDMDDR